MTARSTGSHVFRSLLILTVAAVGLLLWGRMPIELAAWLFLPVWLICWQLIFFSGFERAKLRRQAWLGQYLRPDSLWSQRLQGGLLMVLLQQLIAAVLALWLVLRLRLVSADEVLALLAALLLWLVLVAFLRGYLSRHVISGRLGAVVRRLSVSPVAASLAMVLIGLAVFRTHPHYGDMALAQALHYGLQGLPGDSILSVLLRLVVTMDVAQHWAIQSLDRSGVPGRPLVLAGWVIVFAQNSLFAWSWVRAMAGWQALFSSIGGADMKRDIEQGNSEGPES